MQMHSSAILCIATIWFLIIWNTTFWILRISLCNFRHEWSTTGAHHSGVNRDEQIASYTSGQQVAEQDTHRAILWCNNYRSQIVGGVYSVGLRSIN